MMVAWIWKVPAMALARLFAAMFSSMLVALSIIISCVAASYEVAWTSDITAMFRLIRNPMLKENVLIAEAIRPSLQWDGCHY